MKLTFALCLAAMVVVCTPARAQSEAPTVVLVSRQHDHPLFVQLHDELTALGLELRPVAPPIEEAELGKLARQHSAAAVVFVDERAAQIVISVEPERAEGLRGKFVIAPGAGTAAEPNLLALRAVELLRGLLLPIEKRARPEPEPGDSDPRREPTMAPPPAPAAESHDEAPRKVEDQPSRDETATERSSSLLLAPALVWSPGGVDPTFGLRLAAEYRFVDWLGLEVSGLLPTGPSQAEASGGALDVRILAAGAALRASTDLGEQLSVGGGVGVAALWTRWERTTSAPTPDLQDEAWTALPYVHAGGTFWLHPVAGVRADAFGGWSTSAVELEAPPPVPVPGAAARASATFGRPLLLLSLGFELRL